MRFVLLWFVSALCLAGCMVGPDYQKPELETPEAYRFEEREATELSNTLWWEQFGEPVLNDLIRTALHENKDLRIATARVEEFLARLGVTRAAFYPQVGADAVAGREGLSGVAPFSAGTGSHPTSDFYQGFVSASWEIDLWGRIRRANEAARADLLSQEEGRRTVILTLVSAVANSYINLRNLDRQLEIARDTARTRQETLALFELRFQGGVVSELELSQVNSEYQAALATIPPLQNLIAQRENALSVLIGHNPGAIPRGTSLAKLHLPAVPVGLPSDLLLQRPDILQAEQDLIAANARIGVARAAYFPAISLTGALGTVSSELSDLFTGDSKAWNYAVPLSLPIFTAGRIKGEIQAAEAVQRQVLAAYERSVQNGFREVEDALVGQSQSRKEFVVLARQVEALRTYAELARLRYDEGYSSYIEVLDAERNLFDVELSYERSRAALLQTLVQMYKALGGGWVVTADNLSSAVIN
ncbi:MAG: RND transporter [Desulfuromonadales bacterium C00003096]|jgi:multidrug efflux system outer membrane protein|nr:MAG: RND transporter [Desulfuromonadales bacterium C00003096]